MKKRILSIVMCMTLVCGLLSTTSTVHADSAKVVTIGADLSDSQKQMVYEYFGVDENKVAIIEVNNQEERQYLEGVATEAQIGYRTYSCAYIEPTKKGNGINVKIANLNWVTSYMIKSTLATAGIYDCNVVAAAPFEVSGTGALTGVMKAFETVTGTTLDEEKKEIATEELVITGDLAEEIGSDQAVGIITEVKDSVIGENIVIADQIEQVIIDSSKKYNVTLTDEQVQMITATMEKIANQKYDYSRLQDTFKSIADSSAEKLGIAIEDEKVSGFFAKIGEFFRGIVEWIKNIFTTGNGNSQDLGILENTDDSILGDDVIIDATEEIVVPSTQPSEKPTVTPQVTPEATPEETPQATVEVKETATPSATPTTSPIATATVAPTATPNIESTTEPTLSPR